MENGQGFKDKINKLFCWIKENVTVLILIPTVVGGLWQVLSLAMISMSFIRFFSFSQLVPDGLLVIIISLIALIFAAIWSFFTKEHIQEDESQTANILSDSSICFFYLSATVLFVIITSILIRNNLTSNLATWKLLIAVPAAVTFFSTYQSLIQKAIRYCSEKYKHYLIPLEFLLLPMMLVIGAFIINAFHQSFKLPHDLANLKNFACIIRNENGKRDAKTSIVYFNDKFIFTETQPYLIDKRNDTIFYGSEYKIYPFEELLTKEKCIPFEIANVQRKMDSVQSDNKLNIRLLDILEKKY